MLSPFRVALWRQSILWDNVPSVSAALLDSSLNKFVLDSATSALAFASVQIYASSLGCQTDTFANAALAAIPTVDSTQYTFK